jgi:hypothetical protein
MASFVLILNGTATVAENLFNAIGYLPRSRFQVLKEYSEKGRFRFGSVQSIAGIALVALGKLIEAWQQQDSQKYLSFAQQMASLGVLYLNHGIFNMARSYAEQQDLGAALCAYDFYGRKLLPPLAPPFDLAGLVFERMRRELDRIQFITLLPLNFCLRS